MLQSYDMIELDFNSYVVMKWDVRLTWLGISSTNTKHCRIDIISVKQSHAYCNVVCNRHNVLLFYAMPTNDIFVIQCSAGSFPTSCCILSASIALSSIHLSVGNNKHQPRPHQRLSDIREPTKRIVTSAGVNVMILNIEPEMRKEQKLCTYIYLCEE